MISFSLFFGGDLNAADYILYYRIVDLDALVIYHHCIIAYLAEQRVLAVLNKDPEKNIRTDTRRDRSDKPLSFGYR